MMSGHSCQRFLELCLEEMDTSASQWSLTGGTVVENHVLELRRAEDALHWVREKSTLNDTVPVHESPIVCGNTSPPRSESRPPDGPSIERMLAPDSIQT